MVCSFNESMKQEKVFYSVEDMIDYIAKILVKGAKEMGMFNHDLSYDIIIEKEYFDGDRTGWKNVHRICLKNGMYCIPKCIGCCAF
jgi:hypothetical protein